MRGGSRRIGDWRDPRWAIIRSDLGGAHGSGDSLVIAHSGWAIQSHPTRLTDCPINVHVADAQPCHEFQMTPLPNVGHGRLHHRSKAGLAFDPVARRNIL